MFESKEKKWYSPMESREDALRTVKDTSNMFFFVAALQAALSFFLGFWGLLDAAIYLIGGFFLRRYHSRAAAIVLFVFASLGMSIAIANKAGVNLGGGQNVILGIIVFIGAFRAVEATFKLRGRFSAKAVSDEPVET